MQFGSVAIDRADLISKDFLAPLFDQVLDLCLEAVALADTWRAGVAYPYLFIQRSLSTSAKMGCSTDAPSFFERSPLQPYSSSGRLALSLNGISMV